MQATPATWQMLIAGGWSSNYPLKVLCGGEALSARLAHQILTKLVANCGICMVQQKRPLLVNSLPSRSRVRSVATTEDILGAVPIGRPIANTQVYILDSNSCNQFPLV